MHDAKSRRKVFTALRVVTVLVIGGALSGCATESLETEFEAITGVDMTAKQAQSAAEAICASMTIGLGFDIFAEEDPTQARIVSPDDALKLALVAAKYVCPQYSAELADYAETHP